MKSYEKLEQEFDQISKFNNIISMLNWDIAVNMPTGSAKAREQEIIALTRIVRERLKSDKITALLEQAKKETNSLNRWELANIREIERNITDASCITDDLQERFIRATTICELVWREAKQESDYGKIKPYLQEVLACVKELAAARAEKLGCSSQDALIDKYDPERKSADIRRVYQVLKSRVPVLIQQIVEKQKSQKLLPLPPISVDIQKSICKRLMAIMEFDFNRGRMDESAHPFCGGTPDDVRITNRYAEDKLLSGIMGIIHETGHALYEQSLPQPYRDQPVGRGKGMAIHESQSLFMEMQVGRSRYFCEFLAQFLRDEFGFKGAEYTSDNLYNLATRVKPSFIRVDADEVTYPLHVFLRFELEELLINGNLNLDHLPDYWNSKMEEYLSIRPTSDKVGCLQDIHWHIGAFGYFPAYTNGAIIASMLMARAKTLNPNVTQEISTGKIGSLNRFLNDNLRKFGSFKSTKELIKDATGSEDIAPEIFLAYLEEKYLNYSVAQ